MFDSGAPDEDEEGGTVYGIQTLGRSSNASGACVALSFAPGQLNLRRIKVMMADR